MPSLFLFMLLSCVSMHACNARFLKETNKQGHLFTKVEKSTQKFKEVDEARVLHKAPLQVGLGNFKDLQTQGIQVSKDDRKIWVNQDGENSDQKQQAKTNFLVAESSKTAASGNNNAIMASPNDLQRLNIKEGRKSSQGRSMLGYSSPQDTNEAVYSNKNNVVEDVVVMDYAQPHRKPPIHNEKP